MMIGTQLRVTKYLRSNWLQLRWHAWRGVWQAKRVLHAQDDWRAIGGELELLKLDDAIARYCMWILKH